MAHIDCSFYSESLQKNIHAITFLPSLSADDYLEGRETHYYDSETRFPVLYLLHGSYGDCMDWCLRTGIERYAQEKGIAVIMPSGENSSYINMDHGENYLEFIGKELPEFMAKMFPISQKREETYLAGLSMGGYGAFRVGLQFPDTFGYLASLSGALDMGALQNGSEAHIAKMPLNYRRAVFEHPESIRGSENDLLYLLKKLKDSNRPVPQLYITVGTEDFIYPINEAFYQSIQKMGISAEYQTYPGIHNWDFWDAHIKDVLAWLPNKQS